MKSPSQNKYRLQTLIDRVYDASVEDNVAWAGLAGEIASVFGSTSAVLKFQDTKERVHLVDTTDNLLVGPRQQDWADHWQRNDLWVEKSISHGMSKIITSQDLISDPEFERTEFYGDWLRCLDIYHMIGAVFPVGTDMIGVLGIHRPDRNRAYQDTDRRKLAHFLPHLQRALRLRHKLAQSQQGETAAFDALERTHSAIMIVDARLSVLFASRLAEQMLRQSTELLVEHDILSLRQPGASSQLCHLVSGCIQTASGMAGSSGGAIAVQRGGKPPLILSVAPLRPTMAGSAASQPSALIFIRDPEALSVCAETLCHLFGLTRTEATVAELLTEGRSLDEIATSLSIGMGTVRSHLKKILSKTHTNKQAELVALLLRCAAGIQT